MTQTHHTHQLVYVGQLQGDHGGTYPLHWCRDCGALREGLSIGIAELLPEWTRERARNATCWEYVTSTVIRPKRRALGRGLLEIEASLPDRRGSQ